MEKVPGGRRSGHSRAIAVMLAVSAAAVAGLLFWTRAQERPGADHPGGHSVPPPVEPGAGEFAGLDFPVAPERSGSAGAAEKIDGAAGARVLLARGLVMVRRGGQGRWRIVSRGAELGANDVVHLSPSGAAAARLLGPDGSIVSLAPGAELSYGGPRAWRLAAGRAHFGVTSGRGLPGFTLSAPDGEIRAPGARFLVEAARAASSGRPAAPTRCWIEEGRATLAAGGRELALETGRAGALSNPPAGLPGAEADREWLAALDSAAGGEHGIGELLARVEPGAREAPLEIRSHRVSVTVVDGVARTFVDEVFVNRTGRRLEGVFYYTLPAEAAIGEFAMYVDGRRVSGEVLEKGRARQVFEYIVRQQRDPALLEWVGGNLFKMRIFPIEPQSEKRIQLGYTQVLPRRGGRVTYTYPLLSEKLLKNPLRELAIDFRVACSSRIEGLSSPSHEAAAALSPDGRRGMLAFRARDYSPTRDFAVSYAVPEVPECLAFANRRPDEDEPYFMLQLCPRADPPARPAPRRLVVIVDGSASIGARDYAAAAEFAAAASALSSDLDIALVRAGQRAQVWGRGFVPADGAAAGIREFLKGQPPLGATDLAAGFRAAAELLKPGESAEIVYVGDGVDTLGEAAGPALVREICGLFAGRPARISCAALGSNYDRGVLAGLAGATGGSFVRVEGAADAMAAADRIVDGFFRPALTDASVEIEGLKADRVHPRSSASLPAGETLVVLGRLAAGGRARVTLRARAGDRPFERSWEADLSAGEERNRFLPRLWARAHMEDLLSGLGLGAPAADARLRREVVELSLGYQIMSPFTSFLVLESEEDYARYGIQRRVKMLDWRGEEGGLLSGAGRGSGGAAAAAISPEATKPQLDLGAGVQLDLSPDGRLPTDDSREELDGSPAQSDSLGWEEGQRVWDVRDLSGIVASFPRPDLGLSWHEFPQSGWSSGYGRWYYRPSEPPILCVGPVNRLAGIELDALPCPPAFYQRRLARMGATDATLLHLALALEGEGRCAEARAALAPLLARRPAEPELLLEDACLRHRTRDRQGAFAVFERALALAAEKDRPAMRERIARLLWQLGEYDESQRRHAALAREAADPKEAARLAAEAGGERKLWEDLLARWPDSPEVALAAGRALAGSEATRARGVELLRRARELGADFSKDLETLAKAGLKAEARAEAGKQLAAAADAEQARGGLCDLDRAIRGAGRALARRTLESPRPAATPAAGAALHLIGWGSTTAADLAVALKVLGCEDLAAESRTGLFHALQDIRREEAIKVLAPLFADAGTPERRKLAADAAEALANGGFDAECLRAVGPLLERGDLDAAVRQRLTAAECRALFKLGRWAEARTKLGLLVGSCSDPQLAAGAILPILWDSRPAGVEPRDAAPLVEALAARFPADLAVLELASQLARSLRDSGREEEAAGFVARLAARHPEVPDYVLAHAQLLAGKGRLREAAAALRAGIKAVAARPPEKPAPPPAGSDARFYVQQAAEAERERANRRVALVHLLGRVSGLDAGLRAGFLREAAAAAATEDPDGRPWTEARLLCLQAAGDRAGWLRLIEKLSADEPGDPFWPRRLAAAHLAAGRAKAAREILARISDAQPDDADLALALHELSTRLNDAAGAEKFRARAFKALETRSDLDWRYASGWEERGRLDWALWAYRLEVAEKPGRSGSRWASLRAGQVAAKLGRSEEAIGFLFAALDGDWDETWKASDELLALAGQEENFRRIEPRLKATLAAGPEPARAAVLHLLGRRLALLGNRAEAAEQALSAAAGLDLASDPCNAAAKVADALFSVSPERAERYALEGGGKLSAEARRSLIRGTAQDLKGQEKERLLRRLLAEPDESEIYDRGALVKVLYELDRPAEAEAELRKLDLASARDVWCGTVRHLMERDEPERAARLALEARERELREIGEVIQTPNYSSNREEFYDRFLECCDKLLAGGRLPADLRARAEKLLLETARKYFAGGGSEYASPVYRGGPFEKYGLRARVDELAAEAAASGSLRRVLRAAAYWNEGGRRDEAKRLYRQALSMEGADRRAILQPLYSLLTGDAPAPEWPAALECLEELRRLKVFDEIWYRLCRAECLSKLGRRDEALALCREALARPEMRKPDKHWHCCEVAHRAAGLKDWKLAAEAYEAAAALARRSAPYDRERLPRIYGDCASAWAEAGQTEKALECYLRGMSVASSAGAGYMVSSLRDEALARCLKDRALEAAVAEHEKAVAASGGAEKPHLRLVFAEAFKRAGRTREMLAQLRVAADAMPEDVPLRKELIAGHVALGDTDGAIEAYRAWALRDPQNLELWRGLGDLYAGSGREDQALLAWATMAEVRPLEAEGHRAYAQKLVGLKLDSPAAAALRRAVRCRPTEHAIARELADVYARLKQPELSAALWAEGERACRQAIRDLPDDPAPWLNLGLFLREQGRGADERAVYEQAIRREWPRFRNETVEEAKRRLREIP